MKQQTAQEINQEAADWVAKVDRGLSRAEQAELEHWLSKDDRRVGAYGRMRAIALQTERAAALGPVHSPQAYDYSRYRDVSRRHLLVGGTIAATLVGAGIFGFRQLDRGRYDTRKGEARQVALDDGSVVTLNTETDLKVALEADRRTVAMRAGEALFDVARDPSRPFLVSVGNARIRVLGTSFLVRALPGRPVEVLVRHGLVEVSCAGIAGIPRRLTAKMRAVAPLAGEATAAIQVDTVSEAAVVRAMAWREGDIDFEGETLQQAAAEFARYSDTRISVDSALAREEIAGVYQANDPVGFARAVAGSLRAKVSITDNEIHIRK